MRFRLPCLLVAGLVLLAATSCRSGSAGTAGTAGGAGTAAASPPAKLTVSYIGAEPAALPILIAQDTGIFEKHGLNVDLQVIAGAPSIAALVSGQTQSATGGSSDILGAAVGGAQLVVLAVMDASFPGQLYASPKIKTAADLKGKKIAVSNPGSSFDVVTRESLPKMGLQPDKDVTIIATGSVANAVTALLNGAVDASPAQTGPDTVKLEAAGFHPIYNMSGVKSAGDAITVNRSYMTAHRDVIQRYIDALVEADARERHDKPLALQVMQKRMDLNDQTTLNAIYDFFTQPNILPPQPYATVDQFELPLKQLATKNEKAQGFDLNTIIDSSFVKSAVDRGLDK